MSATLIYTLLSRGKLVQHMREDAFMISLPAYRMVRTDAAPVRGPGQKIALEAARNLPRRLD